MGPVGNEHCPWQKAQAEVKGLANTKKIAGDVFQHHRMPYEA